MSTRKTGKGVRLGIHWFLDRTKVADLATGGSVLRTTRRERAICNDGFLLVMVEDKMLNHDRGGRNGSDI